MLPHPPFVMKFGSKFVPRVIDHDVQAFARRFVLRSPDGEPHGAGFGRTSEGQQARQGDDCRGAREAREAGDQWKTRLRQESGSGLAATIDRWVDAGLAKAKLSSAAPVTDGEFVRRVTLDLIGRIPTEDEVVTFLADKDPDKRLNWINSLLLSPGFGGHYAAVWRELMMPRDMTGVKKTRDDFSPWLAQQFNRNRGWNGIVRELLTAEGRIREHPESGFILANCENSEPMPNLMADATARLFWGVQLRCAECHDHPYAPWKQADFWGTAAFFGRLRKGYEDGKNPIGWTFTEAPFETPKGMGVVPGAEMRADLDAGAAVKVPDTGRKLAGQVIPARFLNGETPGWKDAGPYRPRFAEWATSAEHPWFARNAVNRLWAHFFGRGFVMPLDGQFEKCEASHPELLDALAKDFAASGFNLKQLIRSICMSQTYQRSCQPTPGSEADETYLSHHKPRIFRAEMLYDSLSVVLQPPGRKPGSKGGGILPANPIPELPRDEFIRAYASRVDENMGSSVNLGIPQVLELMNGKLQTALETALNRISKSNMGKNEAIESAFRIAYARSPSVEERRWVAESFTEQRDVRETSAGLLWTLLNSAEFVLNH
jgi:hypothetical protein